MANNYKRGDHDIRPWGTWEVLEVGDNFCVKKITVTPGNILSLQSHNHRAEHWTIVDGEAVVTLNDKLISCKVDDTVYIPVQAKHRIQNNGSKNMVFIEIQVGDNLDENDIIRYQDSYGRN